MKNIFVSLIAFFTFFSARTQSIAYRDVNPDSMIACPGGPCIKHYLLDINQDGVNDFDFSLRIYYTGRCYFGNFSDSVTVLPLNSNSVAAAKLTLNETIGSNSNINWKFGRQKLRINRTTCGEITSRVYSGDWADGKDGYLAVKLVVNNRSYYGWVRLLIQSIGIDFTIKDYAYNTHYKHAILAGQTGLLGDLNKDGINEKQKTPILVNTKQQTSLESYPNPFSTSSTISFNLNKPQKVLIKVLDMNGNLVKLLCNTLFMTGLHQLDWKPSENIRSGVYVLQMQGEDFFQTKEILFAK